MRIAAPRRADHNLPRSFPLPVYSTSIRPPSVTITLIRSMRDSTGRAISTVACHRHPDEARINYSSQKNPDSNFAAKQGRERQTLTRIACPSPDTSQKTARSSPFSAYTRGVATPTRHAGHRKPHPNRPDNITKTATPPTPT